jgi:hypothetical protein
LRIANEADAKAVVRKYINGTRSRHGRTPSITMDEEIKGPDEKGIWTVKGSYVTEYDGKEQFTASVTSRGEVLLGTAPRIQDTSGRRPSKFTNRTSKPSPKRIKAR